MRWEVEHFPCPAHLREHLIACGYDPDNLLDPSSPLSILALFSDEEGYPIVGWCRWCLNSFRSTRALRDHQDVLLNNCSAFVELKDNPKAMEFLEAMDEWGEGMDDIQLSTMIIGTWLSRTCWSSSWKCSRARTSTRSLQILLQFVGPHGNGRQVVVCFSLFLHSNAQNFLGSFCTCVSEICHARCSYQHLGIPADGPNHSTGFTNFSFLSE